MFFFFLVSLFIYFSSSLSSLLAVVIATVCCFQWYNYIGVDWYGESLQCDSSWWMWHDGERWWKTRGEVVTLGFSQISLWLWRGVGLLVVSDGAWWEKITIKRVRIDGASSASFFLWFLSFFFFSLFNRFFFLNKIFSFNFLYFSLNFSLYNFSSQNIFLHPLIIARICFFSPFPHFVFTIHTLLYYPS